MVQSVTILSPFAEYHGRKAVDECEEFPLRRDSAPDEAVGKRYPDREVEGASLFEAEIIYKKCTTKC